MIVSNDSDKENRNVYIRVLYCAQSPALDERLQNAILWFITFSMCAWKSCILIERREVNVFFHGISWATKHSDFVLFKNAQIHTFFPVATQTLWIILTATSPQNIYSRTLRPTNSPTLRLWKSMNELLNPSTPTYNHKHINWSSGIEIIIHSDFESALTKHETRYAYHWNGKLSLFQIEQRMVRVCEWSFYCSPVGRGGVLRQIDCQT